MPTIEMLLIWKFECLAVLYEQMLENLFSVMSLDVCKTFINNNNEEETKEKLYLMKQKDNTIEHIMKQKLFFLFYSKAK